MNNTIKHSIPPVPEGFELITAGTLQAGDIFLVPTSSTSGVWSNSGGPETAEALCRFIEGAETTTDPRVGLDRDSYYVYAARPVAKNVEEPKAPNTPAGYRIVKTGHVKEDDLVLVNCCAASRGEAPEWEKALGAVGGSVVSFADSVKSPDGWYTARPTKRKTRSRK